MRAGYYRAISKVHCTEIDERGLLGLMDRESTVIIVLPVQVEFPNYFGYWITAGWSSPYQPISLRCRVKGESSVINAL